MQLCTVVPMRTLTSILEEIKTSSHPKTGCLDQCLIILLPVYRSLSSSPLNETSRQELLAKDYSKAENFNYTQAHDPSRCSLTCTKTSVYNPLATRFRNLSSDRNNTHFGITVSFLLSSTQEVKFSPDNCRKLKVQCLVCIVFILVVMFV